LKAIVNITGFIASLTAAYLLVDTATILRVFGIMRPSYMIFASFSLACAVLFVIAWLGKLSNIVKWTGVTIMVGVIFMMTLSPVIPRIIYILAALGTATTCLMFAETREGSRDFPGCLKTLLVAAHVLLLLGVLIVVAFIWR